MKSDLALSAVTAIVTTLLVRGCLDKFHDEHCDKGCDNGGDYRAEVVKEPPPDAASVLGKGLPPNGGDADDGAVLIRCLFNSEIAPPVAVGYVGREGVTNVLWRENGPDLSRYGVEDAQ